MNRVVSLMLCWATLWMSGRQQSSEPTTASVSIEGMHCDACAESIHETVVVIPGIESCEVSYENSSARMTADSPATIETAINRIRLLGFTVQQADPS